MDHIVKMTMDKVALISLAHVTQSFFESDGSWIVRNQHLANVAYKIRCLFIEYVGCTCGWALQGNFCKHQIVIIFIATDVTQEDVIDYCGTWYTNMHGGLMAMFANSKHILD